MPPPAGFSGADTDERLMLAYASGHAGAFDLLYARHKAPVYRYLMRHGAQAAVADELFQDVWMNLIRARGSYAPTAKFTTWLYTLAHNRLVDHWRSRVPTTIASVDDDRDDDARDLVHTVAGTRVDEPETRMAAREIGERFARSLALLPLAQRDAFLLHQEAGLSLAEIAATTGVGVETAKSRIRYAVAKLRADLADLK